MKVLWAFILRIWRWIVNFWREKPIEHEADTPQAGRVFNLKCSSVLRYNRIYLGKAGYKRRLPKMKLVGNYRVPLP